MIKINGVALARQPQKLNPSYNDLASEQSGRNTAGDMLIDRVATKVKLELSWGGLTKGEMSGILQALSPVFVQVTYDDPKTGGPRTITCYSNDPTMEVDHRMPNGEYFYRSLAINLIEK